MEDDRQHTGLSVVEAQARLAQYGPNDVQEQRRGKIKKLLAPLYAPISLMLCGAALLSLVDGRMLDFYFISALYVCNYLIQKWQEFKADKAIQKLREKLLFDVWALRDGKWISVNVKELVPGDRIRLGLGSMIPADCRVLAAKNLSVNEAVLTGESMPKEKKEGDAIYSGSYISTGEVEASITATGRRTNFGKTIFSIEKPAQKSILEKDILSISRFLTIISIGAVCVLSAVFLIRGRSIGDLLTLDISLVIAGIPVALPAVMAVMLSIGASGLAKKFIIVRRLSALQDLSNVDLLLTDKTGTLTKNEIRVVNAVSYQKAMSTDDIITYAYYAAAADAPDAIDAAIVQKFHTLERVPARVRTISFTPYDGQRKRSTALVELQKGTLLVTLGAPQVIASFGNAASRRIYERFEKDIEKAARDGLRTLAIAVRKNAKEEKSMTIAGLLFLADPLEEKSKETLQFMRKNGIGVKMLTGDNKLISQRIAGELNLSGMVLGGDETRKLIKNTDALEKKFDGIGVFSEILPKDKYELVEAGKRRYTVAVTGDGINDLPALRMAHVGIAVAGAVTALKSMADIVLLGKGLGVIRDAILESRKIFVRLYNYSVYRISESFRLISTILILGLWYGVYPLQPLQIILLAFLNDIPIISLAFDRVKISGKPSKIDTKKRLTLSLLFGTAGILNSIILFFVATRFLHLQTEIIQTLFFLKLTVSGHMLIFVAHTKEHWYKFLPSKEVIIATVLTQLLATSLALTGILMPAPITPLMALGIWIWAFIWMLVAERMKLWQQKAAGSTPER